MARCYQDLRNPTHSAEVLIGKVADEGLWTGTARLDKLLPTWVSPAVEKADSDLRTAFLTQATPPRLLASWHQLDYHPSFLTSTFCRNHIDRVCFDATPFDEALLSLRDARAEGSFSSTDWGYAIDKDVPWSLLDAPSMRFPGGHTSDQAIPFEMSIRTIHQARQQWCHHVGNLARNDETLLDRLDAEARSDAPAARTATRCLIGTADQTAAARTLRDLHARPLSELPEQPTPTDEITKHHVHRELPITVQPEHLERVIAQDTYGAIASRSLAYAAHTFQDEAVVDRLIRHACAHEYATSSLAMAHRHTQGGSDLLRHATYVSYLADQQKTHS